MKLHLNNATDIRAGSTLTGIVIIPTRGSSASTTSAVENADKSTSSKISSRSSTLLIELIGRERTVVALPNDEERPERSSISYLKRNCSESHVFHCTSLEVDITTSLSPTNITTTSTTTTTISVPFQLDLPNHLIGSLERVIDPGNDYFGLNNFVLPHQCHVEYTLKIQQQVLLSNDPDDTNLQCIIPIQIHPAYGNPNTIHRSVSFQIGASIPLVRSYLCGLWEEPYETFEIDLYSSSSTSTSSSTATTTTTTLPIVLFPGQLFQVRILDTDRQILNNQSISRNAITTTTTTARNKNMKHNVRIKLTEQWHWTAQHREKTYHSKSWVLEPEEVGSMTATTNTDMTTISSDKNTATNTTNNSHNETPVCITTSSSSDQDEYNVLVRVPKHISTSYKGVLIQITHELFLSIQNNSNETVAAKVLPVQVIVLPTS